MPDFAPFDYELILSRLPWSPQDKLDRMRARRARRFASFRQRQAERRDWVNVGDVVMWSAGVGGFASRDFAYDFIIKDVLELRIERLISLHPDRFQTLNSDRMRGVIDWTTRQEGRRYEFLSYAWMSQADFEAFRSRYHLAEPPPYLRPRSPEEAIIDEAIKRLVPEYQRNPRLTKAAADRVLADMPLTVEQRKDIRRKARGGEGKAGRPPKVVKS
jgi:hypothetical protein